MFDMMPDSDNSGVSMCLPYYSKECQGDTIVDGVMCPVSMV